MYPVIRDCKGNNSLFSGWWFFRRKKQRLDLAIFRTNYHQSIFEKKAMLYTETMSVGEYEWPIRKKSALKVRTWP
jgi:hypothetical protein